MGIKDDKPVIQTRSYRVGNNADGTTNVIPFPSQPRELTLERGEELLKNLRKQLRFHQKNIENTLEILSEHQLRCAKTEDDYDDQLVAYADRIGLENVKTEYINYGSHISVKDGHLVVK